MPSLDCWHRSSDSASMPLTCFGISTAVQTELPFQQRPMQLSTVHGCAGLHAHRPSAEGQNPSLHRKALESTQVRIKSPSYCQMAPHEMLVLLGSCILGNNSLPLDTGRMKRKWSTHPTRMQSHAAANHNIFIVTAGLTPPSKLVQPSLRPSTGLCLASESIFPW